MDYIPVDKMGNWNEEKYNKKKRESIRRKGYVIGKEGCIWTQKRRM